MVDTDARTVSRRSERLDFMPSNGRLVRSHFFESNGSRLCCFSVDDRSGGQPTTYIVVEYQNLRTMRRKTVLPRCGDADLFAAPDRKLVAVRTPDQIVIVDSAGNLVGQTTVER
jgi:hypothetical protein